MKAARTTVPSADFSNDPVGIIGPYTSVPDVLGLFDMRTSHERSRVNHASFGARPALLNRPNPASFTADYAQTNAVGQIVFPHGAKHNSDNTFFGVFEAHRAGGALPQGPFGMSISGSANQRGQLLIANGPNFLRVYTYTRTEPDNFLTFGTQRVASYQYPTNGSLDNQMIFACGVLRNGVGIDLYVPGVNAAAPVATIALTASDLFFAGSDADSVNVYETRYTANGFSTSTERTRCFGYAHRAFSLAEVNQVHADLKAYYTPLGLTFI